MDWRYQTALNQRLPLTQLSHYLHPICREPRASCIEDQTNTVALTERSNMNERPHEMETANHPAPLIDRGDPAEIQLQGVAAVVHKVIRGAVHRPPNPNNDDNTDNHDEGPALDEPRLSENDDRDEFDISRIPQLGDYSSLDHWHRDILRYAAALDDFDEEKFKRMRRTGQSSSLSLHSLEPSSTAPQPEPERASEAEHL